MLWPLTVAQDHNGYRCSIKLASGDQAHRPYVFAIEIERLDGRPVSLRDVRRLPLATAIARAEEAASITAQVQDPSPDPERARQDRAELLSRLERARAPRGAPQRGKSVGWYAELLEAHRALVLNPSIKHPNAELARRKRVSPKKMNVWLFRARKLEQERQKGKG